MENILRSLIGTKPLDFPLGDNSDIVLSRHTGGQLVVTWVHRDVCGEIVGQGFLPHAIKQYSEDFETGYAGSGPADLALNILAAFFPAPPCPISTEVHVSVLLLGTVDGDMGEAGRREARYQMDLLDSWEEATVRCERGARASRPAWYLHQPFKCQFLSMPLSCGGCQIIRGHVIREWALHRLEDAGNSHASVTEEEYLAQAA